MLSPQEYHTQLVESALAWWREAGVEHVCESESINWLASPSAAIAARPAIGQRSTEPPKKALHTPLPLAQPSPPAVAPDVAWPSTVPDLKAAITQMAALPGCTYGTASVAPAGEAGSTAMVVGDFPEEEEVAAALYGAGPVGRLRTAMLLAAEILPDLSFITSLAHSRPASASLAKGDLHQLGSFVRHQIALVQPKIVIIFGSAACEALLAQDLMQARGRLHYINHDDRKTAAVATFHPRTLMAQPQLKAQAWKDLQMLARKDYL